MADISMSLDDTLELDTIIKASNIAQDPIGSITYSGPNTKDYNMNGIETHTSVFDPQQAGTYTIPVNGQELSVEVTDTSTIPDSGVSRWKFEQDVTDSWGGNDGTNNSGTFTQNSIVGNYALSFDGVDDYVSLPALPNLSAFSISVWVNGDSGAVIGFTENNNIEIRKYGSWSFRMNNNTYQNGPGGNFGSDTHLVATWDGSTREWFVNGTSMGTISTSSNNHKGEGTSIGRRSNVSGYEVHFSGVIDDPRLYNNRLSSTQVSNLYNTGSI